MNATNLRSRPPMARSGRGAGDRSRWRGAPMLAVVATSLALGGLASGAAAASAATVATTPASAATPPPASAVEPATTASQVVPMAFGVHGAAEVRTGIRGSVTIAGTFAGSYDRTTGKFVGAFSLTPTMAHVVVLGLMPVTAETDWIFTEPVTGEWRDGVLSMRAAARIKHPRLIAFGHVIAGGENCATTRPSIMELRSNAATPIADPLAGGTLTTSGQGFVISALAGCGWLDGLLSAVAAGGGNQATLELTPLQAG